MGTCKSAFMVRTLLLVATIVMGIATVSSTSFAFGSFNLKRSTVEEADGRWQFSVDVDYGSKPHIGHI
ncbi:MAG: hypothetical protein FWD57_08885, partial [Polyangiaceae bacterium]|nr:hypothetical protein [Polyangiaceae bacterium]